MTVDDDYAEDLRDWHNPDGAALLDDLVNWFGTYIRVTFEPDLEILALWVVHTHLVKELRTTPRLQIDAMMHGSGKTTLLEHLERLCVSGMLVSSAPTASLIARTIHAEMTTLLFDEVDRTLHADQPGTRDILAIVNSGYRLGAVRPVQVPTKGGGWDMVKMSTFCPVALSGNNPLLPNDVASRCLRILLVPDLDGAVHDSDWEEIEDDAKRLHDRIAGFAEQVRDGIKGLKIDVPEGCIGRLKEIWRPLKRVAVMAGGDWPQRCDRLIGLHIEDIKELRDADLMNKPAAVVLLEDLHQVWGGFSFGETDLVPTREMVSRLVLHNPDVWGLESPYGRKSGKPLTAKRLGSLVYQATRQKSQRDPGHRGERGYLKSQFTPSWRRLGLQDTPLNDPAQPGGNPAQDRSGSTGSSNSSGSFKRDPGCIHCFNPVAGGQRDSRGKPAHLSCQRAAAAGVQEEAPL